jgi:hypothetical protein
MAACVTVTVMLGGCGMARDYMGLEARAGAPAREAGPPSPARGSPVPPAAAQILDSAPAGGRLDYHLADGRRATFVLGASYQSGWQVPCRIGRVKADASNGPTAYAFCHQGDQWYAMTPVVVSGY